MPGSLDQQSADVAVADLADRALPAALAGGVLRGHQADERHELLCAAEAAEVADLGRKTESAEGVNAAQAAQPADQLTPGPLLGRLPDRLLQLADASVDEIDGVQVAVERDLLGGVLEALLAEPLATHDRPALVGNRRP